MLKQADTEKDKKFGLNTKDELKFFRSGKLKVNFFRIIRI